MTSEVTLRASTLIAVNALYETSPLVPWLDIDDLIDHLRSGPSGQARLDYSAARTLLRELGLSLRDLPKTNRERAQIIVKLVVERYKPGWLSTIIGGRNVFKEAAPVPVRQCFELAGVFEDYVDPDTRRWWDQLCADAFAERDRQSAINGTEAELLCLEYETERLASAGHPHLRPKATALDTSGAGYDVESYDVSSGIARPLYIEVKGFVGRTPRFHLSPGEWSAACSLKRSYQLQVWSLDRRKLEFEINGDDLVEHVPSNRGLGRWQDALINVSNPFIEDTCCAKDFRPRE